MPVEHSSSLKRSAQTPLPTSPPPHQREAYLQVFSDNSIMNHRQLAPGTKIPVKLSQNDLLYVESKVGGAEHKLLLDSYFPGVVYKCDSEESCPVRCTYPSVPLMYPNGGYSCLDKVKADLDLGGAVSVPSFTVGRLPTSYMQFFTRETRRVVDGVLGIGLPEFPGELKGSTELDGSLPTQWKTYSLYVPPVGEEGDAFLSVNGIDDAPIDAQGLKGFEFTAIKGEGFTFDLDDYYLDGARSNAVSCTLEDDCTTIINSASPLIVLSKTAWKEVQAYVNSYSFGCGLDYYGDDLVYVCNDDVELPTIGFKLGDQSFFMSKEHYTVPFPGSTSKVAVLVYYDVINSNRFSFGAPFFRAFYSAFNTASRSMTLYCKEDETCITDYVPLDRPLRPTSAPPSNGDSDGNDNSDWSTITPTYGLWNSPYTNTPYPTKADGYYTRKQEKVTVSYTSEPIKNMRIAAFAAGIAGIVLLIALIVFAQVRKRKFTTSAPASGAASGAGDFEELSTPHTTTNQQPATAAATFV